MIGDVFIKDKADFFWNYERKLDPYFNGLCGYVFYRDFPNNKIEITIACKPKHCLKIINKLKD